jgi:hypothetical protein
MMAMAAKGDDLVKYIAERLTEYVEAPSSIRDRRQSKRTERPSWQVRWFGMLPFSIGMWLGGRNPKRLFLQKSKGTNQTR